MKKLDHEQSAAVKELRNVIIARELVNVVKLPPHGGGPRFESLWQGDARLYIIDLLRSRRDSLESDLGLNISTTDDGK